MKPEWKICELAFEAHFQQYGKKAWVHRFSDTAQAIGLNGAGAIAPSQPSDYIVTHDGVTFFAEVKFSSEPVSFSHSKIRPKQMGCARMSVPAGGLFFFFIKSKVLGKWFRVPASVITTSAIKSTKWSELGAYEWSI